MRAAFCVFAILLASSLAAQADIVPVGILSYDTFIPGAPGTPGVDAFDIANLTGPDNFPPDFPASDPLTFQSAVLTLTLSDMSQQILILGDIEPGLLLDAFGNPVVQVPDNASFVSAELKATLSPTTFMLSDGTSFAASSSSLDVLLTPSSGQTLVADTDITTINVYGSPVTAPAPVPEPSSVLLLAGALLLIAWKTR